MSFSWILKTGTILTIEWDHRTDHRPGSSWDRRVASVCLPQSGILASCDRTPWMPRGNPCADRGFYLCEKNNNNNMIKWITTFHVFCNTNCLLKKLTFNNCCELEDIYPRGGGPSARNHFHKLLHENGHKNGLSHSSGLGASSFIKEIPLLLCERDLSSPHLTRSIVTQFSLSRHNKHLHKSRKSYLSCCRRSGRVNVTDLFACATVICSCLARCSLWCLSRFR